MLSTKFKSRRTPNAIWAASIVLAKHTYPNVTYPWPWAEKGVLKTIGLSHCSLSGRHIKNIQQGAAFPLLIAAKGRRAPITEMYSCKIRPDSFRENRPGSFFSTANPIGFHEKYRTSKICYIRTFSDNSQLTIWTISPLGLLLLGNLG